MSKVCDKDCFNCKFDDCIMDDLGREPCPRELSQDPKAIKRRERYRANKEKYCAQKRAHYQLHKEEINARRRKRAKEKRNARVKKG